VTVDTSVASQQARCFFACGGACGERG